MLAPSHPSWDPRVVMREARSLVAQGHRVALVAKHDPRRTVPAGIEVLPLPPQVLSRRQRALQIRRICRIARQWQADVYHAHEVESLAAGIWLKRRTKARLIFDAHECFHFTAARFLTGWKSRLATAVATRLLRWMSRQADQVIVVSYTNLRFYHETCGCRKVTLIHNSPPPELFPFTDKPPGAEHTLTHDGHFGADRGSNEVLDALAIVRRHVPAKLIVVGKIPEQNQEQERFAQRVRDLDLEGAVDVTGWIPYDQVGPNLNRGSIGLVAMRPSANNYGSLSNKLFNYMCTGQAVIGPAGSDTAQVLEHANCGVAVDVNDPQSLAEALLTLLRDPQRTRELGANARRAIETEFGWHKMETLLAEIYADLGK